MAVLNFNAHEVEPTTDFEPVPPGKYQVVISASEWKENKTGTGSHLELTLIVIEGEYANRKLWARIHLHNASAGAVKFARGQMSAICRAVGVMVPSDSSELHNIPFVANVQCKPRTDGNGLENEVKGFYAVNDPAVPSAAPAPTYATPTAPAAATAAPAPTPASAPAVPAATGGVPTANAPAPWAR